MSTPRHGKCARRSLTVVGRLEKPGSEGVDMPREALLTRTLVELADSLVDDFDVVDLLSRLADRCVEIST